jgi:hypothetical protein
MARRRRVLVPIATVGVTLTAQSGHPFNGHMLRRSFPKPVMGSRFLEIYVILVILRVIFAS